MKLIKSELGFVEKVGERKAFNNGKIKRLFNDVFFEGIEVGSNVILDYYAQAGKLGVKITKRISDE